VKWVQLVPLGEVPNQLLDFLCLHLPNGQLFDGNSVAPTSNGSIFNPRVTDADIVLLRQDLRAMKMEVIGQSMSLSDTEA